MPLYQRLLREDTENYNVYYKIGICYLNNPYQKEKSIQYLLKASEHINPDYKTNNFRERLAPPEVNYFLGQAYRINGNLNKAIEYYSLFKKDLDAEVFDINVVNEEINSCQVARQLEKTPVYYSSENSGNLINSRFADINPVISGDGNTIVFTRELQFYDAVFFIKKEKNGNWTPPYNLTPDFGLDGNSYCTGLSYYGDEILVYRSDNFDGNIYSSKLIDNKWQKLQKLNENINTKYWESHASISPDGKYIYFTSNRKGGYGGLDIYKAPRIANGEWGIPINLGPVVNSPYNEDTPFISPSDHKLFFSSLGHNGMGGYDIYISEMIGPETWSKPVNMGYPINTTDDDLFLCPFPGNSSKALYSKYDPETSLGLKDIYNIQVYNSVLPRIFSVSGQVNVPTPKMLSEGNVKVTIVDNSAGKIIKQVEVDSLGIYSLKVPQGEYQLLVDGKGIKPISIPIEFTLTQQDDDIVLPLITTQIAAVGEDDLLVTPSDIPKVEIVGPKYIVTDSVPAKIRLKVDKGNDLIVEHIVNNKLLNKEEYLLTKDDFTYVFTPEPGVNELIFTIRDNKGNSSQQEVRVIYEPQPTYEAIAIAEKPEVRPAGMNEFANIATNDLKRYLDSMDNFDYSSLTELYSLLVSSAEENDYSNDDVDKLFSIILTQQAKEHFIQSLLRQNREFTNSISDSILKNSELPISILNILRKEGLSDLKTFNTDMMHLSENSKGSKNLPEYILSFSETDIPIKENEFKIDDKSEIFNSITGKLSKELAEILLDKAATTKALEQFYFNLLISADTDLREILTQIDFDSLMIDNSIDLLEYLFKKADEGKIDKLNLIQQIESANINEKENILLFKEVLANEATGELKLSIQEYDPLEGDKRELSEIINNLLQSSKTKGYGRAEVYDLLINMIGITDIDDFISEMKKHSTGDMDSLLSVIDRNNFSIPLEVIQYLLSETPYFNFSESDINNLLIRMLLEKGIEGYGVLEDSLYSKQLFKKNRFIYTIVLINILLILFIILFWRRKKKSKQQ